MVTNIELDHHSTYALLRELEQAFAEFAAPAGAARARAPASSSGEAATLRLGIDAGDLRAEELAAGRRRVALHAVDGVRCRSCARARARTTC